ncbi:MAG: peptidyl-prolyl cis-trans isomerase [Cytophagaceae bacterium]|nr:peptidyl-prolyl cis-trans isomerase [Cytophagaceae bacterium]
MKKVVLFLVCLPLLFSCELFKKKEENALVEREGKPLARVENQYLYYEDIEGLPGKYYSKEDSAALVQKYIDSWILKQLLLMRAEAQVDESNKELQNKISDCRNSLLIHEFEKQYLTKKLDTAIGEKEIRDYYAANISLFELKQNIIKGYFIKLPKNAPGLDKVKPLISSNREKDRKELKSYCVRFASHFTLEDTIWINFDELVKNTPFNSTEDKVEFLEKNPYAEASDKNNIYYLKIKDYKTSKQVSPMDFVKEQIKNTLINKRSITLINQLKVNIFQEAKNHNEFEIYQSK